MKNKDNRFLLYKGKYHYLSAPEMRLFRKLEELVKDKYEGKYYIVPQVNLGSLLYLVNMKNRSFWWYLWNRVSRKTLDFGLFTKEDFKIKLAIELLDHTHGIEGRTRRDKFVDKVLEKSNINVLWVEKDLSNLEDIKKHL